MSELTKKCREDMKKIIKWETPVNQRIDLMIEARNQIQQLCDEVERLSKTSEEWQKIIRFPKVYDPDGWDRKNFQYSWYEEKISIDEYLKRTCSSTCNHNDPERLEEELKNERHKYNKLQEENKKLRELVEGGKKIVDLLPEGLRSVGSSLKRPRELLEQFDKLYSELDHFTQVDKKVGEE